MDTSTTPIQEDMLDKLFCERLPHEPLVWFLRFQEYLAQEAPRSVLQLYKETMARGGARRRGKKPLARIKTIPQSWVHAKERWQWKQRADAFDFERAGRAARARVLREEHCREEELAMARQLREKGRVLLALPHIRTEMKTEGNQVTHIHIPVNAELFAVGMRLLAESSIIARRALRMPVTYKELDVGSMSLEDLLTLRERLNRAYATCDTREDPVRETRTPTQHPISYSKEEDPDLNP